MRGQPPRTLEDDPRDWFTPDSLASRLKVSDRLIRKWVKERRLRSYKIDGCRRFRPSDVDEFLAQFLDGEGRE